MEATFCGSTIGVKKNLQFSEGGQLSEMFHFAFASFQRQP